MSNYQKKYLKYKLKYLRLKQIMKQQYGGNIDCKTPCEIKDKKDLYDVETCEPLEEHNPTAVYGAVVASEHIPQVFAKPLVAEATKHCKQYLLEESQADIPKYVRDFRVNLRIAKKCQGMEAKDEDEFINKCSKQYKTKDEFFNRAVTDEYLQKHKYKNIHPGVILSPADCRCVIFDSVDKAKEHWIKGEAFTVRTLLNLDFAHDESLIEKASEFAVSKVQTLFSPVHALKEHVGIKSPKVNTALVNSVDTSLSIIGKRSINEMLKCQVNLVVSRLAPQDYHRFHAPVSGKIFRIDDIKNDKDGHGIIQSYWKDASGNVSKDTISGMSTYYYSVQPVIVNDKGTSVFAINRRMNVWVNNPVLGVVVICIIAATCVGSIALTKSDNTESPVTPQQMIDEELTPGNQFGYFRFGGSTLVTVVCGPINWCSRIIDLSLKEKESYVHVGSLLGEKLISRL